MAEYASISMPEDIGEVVRSARLQLGWSQTELAQRCGASQRFVSEFERGKPSAEVGKVLQVLHALGLSFAISTTRTPEHSKALVQECVDRVMQDLQEQPRATKKLADYLAEFDAD